MGEDKAYADLMAADEEVEKLLVQIDQVIKAARSREAGERIALEEYAPRVDEAMKKSRVAFDKWLQETQDLMKDIETLLQEEP